MPKIPSEISSDLKTPYVYVIFLSSANTLYTSLEECENFQEKIEGLNTTLGIIFRRSDETMEIWSAPKTPKINNGGAQYRELRAPI
jgi:hypothetical protein